MKTPALLTAAVAAGLLLPASAHAKLPPAHPPAKSVAGVELAWPRTAGLVPGAQVTVVVESAQRRTRIALLRVSAAGKPIRDVAHRTLRSGIFTARLPAAAGASYQLRATIAGKRYWSWIATPVAVAPGEPVDVARACRHPTTPATAALTLGGPYAAPATEFRYSLVNTSRGACISTGAGYRLEHLRGDGTWEPIAPSGAFQLFAVVIAPLQAFPKNATIPATAVPGTYRIVDSVNAPDGRPIALTSAPFQVVGPVASGVGLASPACAVYRIALDPSTVTPGTTFSYRVDGPAAATDVAEWQRRDGADWVAYPDATVDASTHTASLPPGAPAGAYRLHETVTQAPAADNCLHLAQQVYSAVITVP